MFSTSDQLSDPRIYIRTGNRVNTLLFYGIPSVTNPVPQSLVDLKHGEHVLYAVTEEGWYQAMKTLIKNPELRNHIGQTGRRMVEEKFSADVAAKKYIDMLNTEINQPLFPKKGFADIDQAGMHKKSETAGNGDRVQKPSILRKAIRKAVSFFI